MTTVLSAKATEIADYAQSLLSEGGYNSFSYADISERVQLSKATIHHHFSSKAQLVCVVVGRYRAQAREGMAALDRLADPVAQLQAYVGYWASCLEGGASSFCICAMLAAELPSIPHEVAIEVRGHFQELIDWLIGVIEAGAALGQLRLQGSASTEAQAFMAGVHGAMLAARGMGDPSTFKALAQLLIDKLTLAA